MPLMLLLSSTMSVSCPDCIILWAVSVTESSPSTVGGSVCITCLTCSIIGSPRSRFF